MEKIIECKNLTLGYDNKILVKDMNIEINQGDYVCIIGENGAGKSTFVKTLLGLQAPMSGNIVYHGIKSTDIGYLPQQTIVQRDFPATVREIVSSGRIGKSKGFFYSKEDKTVIENNIQRMSLKDLEKRAYRTLSGGQQQRVLLARALCSTDKILLLDEPVTGLDPDITKELYDIIKELNKDGLTIIMITHDLTPLKEDATHVLKIGKHYFFGTKEVFGEEEY